MAFWNAPLDEPAHARNACLAALDMRRRLARLNAERAAEDASAGRAFVPIRIGIGLNTGECVVGNIGSDLRFDYSALGDSVNVASRIESLTPAYGVEILLGSRTAAEGAAGLAVLAVDVIRVKGKTEPETIYALVGDADLAQTAWFTAFRAAFSRLRAAYVRLDWADARQQIEACRRADAAATLSILIRLYERRIETFERNGAPPASWDGVFTMLSKTG